MRGTRGQAAGCGRRASGGEDRTRGECSLTSMHSGRVWDGERTLGASAGWRAYIRPECGSQARIRGECSLTSVHSGRAWPAKHAVGPGVAAPECGSTDAHSNRVREAARDVRSEHNKLSKSLS